ncbi:EF-hand domain-containing protein [Cribrihabitans neustonicus]|uniref:EF-hand domain-containing protein n=1 Tax=Cribrihabitans neustonicus TaxID=1429085 RepID=UPI003B5BD7A5
MKHTAFIAMILAAAGTIGAGAGMASAGHHGHGPIMTFEEIDADGNGEITKAEMQALKQAHFAKADTDGDGKLTLAEMQAQAREMADARAARMLERFDSDGDGALTEAELPSPPRAGRMFGRADKDNSGGLSKAEFDAARERHADRPGGGHKPGQGKAGEMEAEQN